MARLIKIPRSEGYHDRQAVGDAYPCVICGKAIPLPKWTVHVVNGGDSLCHPDDSDTYEDTAADLGWYPIGSDCLRKHPELKAFACRTI